jgi:hypothetical protein
VTSRSTMDRADGSGSASTGTSHMVLVRLLIALSVMTVFMNLLFLFPLEDSEAQSKQQIPRSSHVLSSLESPKMIVDNPNEVSFPVLSEEEGRQHILDLFKEAKVELTPEIESELPKWSRVQEVVGPHPFLLGLEHCARFRDTVPPLERMLGAAGMFNTGTNLVTHLLKQNCEIPERRQKYGPKQPKESYGMRWQVPVRTESLHITPVDVKSQPNSPIPLHYLYCSGASTRLPSFEWRMPPPRRQRPESTKTTSCPSLRFATRTLGSKACARIATRQTGNVGKRTFQ